MTDKSSLKHEQSINLTSFFVKQIQKKNVK